MKLLFKRIKNELYFWLYFYWVRLFSPYSEPTRFEFNKYHVKYWELHSAKNDLKWGDRLFDWDEIFVSPCTFNIVECGGIPSGKYLVKIGLTSFIVKD